MNSMISSRETLLSSLRRFTPEIDAESAWQKVIRRDKAADGEFVYAVQSTGIYCRPGCPSRRPKRSGVRFFLNCEAAEAAGFRACLRCEPSRRGAKDDPHAEAVRRAAQAMRDGAEDVIDLNKLAASVGLSRFTLLRSFRRVLGVTPAEFVRTEREERFRSRMQAASGSVTEAIYASGFSSSSRLYERAEKTMGMQPSRMKAKGAGETISWSTGESPLGRVLVATTQRGLCAVLFADSDEEAASELQARFGRATLVRDDAGLGETVRRVLSSIVESESAASLPLDVRATSFQHRVWKALQDIPFGQTRTYGEIAKAIGAPRAVRAVGAACGANPLALVVPCHRAVGADGKLTGYRWGVERKRRLLDLERGTSNDK